MAAPTGPFVSVSPTPLRFTQGNEGGKMRAVLAIKNLSGGRVAFTIKVNKPEPFGVSPTCDFLDPMEEKLVRISRTPVKQDGKEQFLILSAPVAPDATRLDRYQFWATLPQGSSKESCKVPVLVELRKPRPILSCALTAMSAQLDGLEAQFDHLVNQHRTTPETESAAQLFTRLTLTSVCLAAILSLSRALLSLF